MDIFLQSFIFLFLLTSITGRGLAKTHTASTNLMVCRFGSFSERNWKSNNDKGNDIDEEENYANKLAEAQKAIAEAEEARYRLSQKNIAPGILQPKRPRKLRSKISRSDAGTLVIDIPATGTSASSLFAGAFSVAWFSSIVPPTFSAIPLATRLFFLPFWMVGGMVAKAAVVDPFISGKLTIGQFAWSLRGDYIGVAPIKEKHGPTDELRGANTEVVAIVNGIPQSELQLYGDMGVISFGLGLPSDELEYLVGEINDVLRSYNREELMGN